MKKIEIFLFFIFVFIVVGNRNRLFAQVINELSPLPLPTPGLSDWVEVFTDGKDINLYQLRDSSGNIKNLSDAVCNGNICTVDWSNRLNKDGDTVKLVLITSPDSPVDQITYGGQGNICIPGAGQSIGRVATIDSPYEPTNLWEKFSTSSKGQTNNYGVLSPCPSPTPIPTVAPTNAPTNMPTNTPAQTSAPAPTSTPKPSVTPTKKPTPTQKDYSQENAELQAAADASQFRYYDSATNEGVLGTSEENSDRSDVSPFAYVLLVLGLIFIGTSFYIFLRNRKRNING